MVMTKKNVIQNDVYMKCGRIPQKIMCKYVRASTSMCIYINIWLGQPCSMQPQPSTVHIQGALANYKAKYRTVPYLYAITRVHFTWSLHAKQIDLYSLVHFDKWVKWFRSPHDLSPVKRIWMEPFEPFFSLPATLQSHNISISALQVFKKRR